MAFAALTACPRRRQRVRAVASRRAVRNRTTLHPVGRVSSIEHVRYPSVAFDNGCPHGAASDRSRLMRRFAVIGVIPLLAAALALCTASARAQTTVRNDEHLASSRSEAWAMNYVGASTLMTAFGETPALPASGAPRWTSVMFPG